jgi:small subunit ribosomal protein S1
VEAGYFVLRVRPGEGAASVAELSQAFSHGIPVEGTVKKVTKGGVEVSVGGVRAFCPISQLDIRYVEEPEEYVDQRFTFRIVRFEEGKGRSPNVVLSRRALLEEEKKKRAEEARARLKEGSVVKGTVTSLAKYGAFVDLGGLEGLLHISELGYGRVEHPGDVLAEGQEIEVQVLKIEEAREGEGNERISLSRRALLQDPWQVEAALLGPGTRRQGTVLRLQPFGAFVELAPGVDGLLHISELAVERHVDHPREVLKVGESVEVTVKSVDLERRRISLSLASEGSEDPGETRTSASGRDPGASFGSLGDFFERSKKGN